MCWAFHRHVFQGFLLALVSRALIVGQVRQSSFCGLLVLACTTSPAMRLVRRQPQNVRMELQETAIAKR